MRNVLPVSTDPAADLRPALARHVALPQPQGHGGTDDLVCTGRLPLERSGSLCCDRSRKLHFAGGRPHARKHWIQIFWVACVAPAIVASVLATWSRRARYIGRIAVGVLMLLGRAVFNAVNLAFGADYGDFADQAHFGWVTAAWRAMVAPNHYLFIGLLVAFEAVVGVLILSGGRRTQLGLIGAIGFHLALWLFGWGVSFYSLLMLPALVLLLRAERRAGTISATSTAPASVARIEASQKG
jgi:hypothetical protein